MIRRLKNILLLLNYVVEIPPQIIRHDPARWGTERIRAITDTEIALIPSARATHYYIRFCPNILRFILRRMVSAIQIINAMSCGKSLLVFDLIAAKGGDRKSIINSLGLSPKQYNSAISALRKSGLVEKINGRYIITLFSEVVLEARQLIESGIRGYWQLKAIDAIWIELPQKERNETIEILIDNPQIRGLLFRSLRPR